MLRKRHAHTQQHNQLDEPVITPQERIVKALAQLTEKGEIEWHECDDNAGWYITSCQGCTFRYRLDTSSKWPRLVVEASDGTKLVHALERKTALDRMIPDSISNLTRPVFEEVATLLEVHASSPTPEPRRLCS